MTVHTKSNFDEPTFLTDENFMRVLLIVGLSLLIMFATSCSSARWQNFKELNQPQTSNHYRDTVINNQKIRIPIPQKKTEAQARKDRQGVLIAVGVLTIWYVTFQSVGEHE